MGPVKPRRTALSISAAPIVPDRRDAPTIASARGRRMASKLRAAAVHSRWSCALWRAGVSSVGKDTWNTPESSERFTRKPVDANRRSMRLFSPSTSASNSRMPFARAITSRCSSSSVPRPRP